MEEVGVWNLAGFDVVAAAVAAVGPAVAGCWAAGLAMSPAWIFYVEGEEGSRDIGKERRDW